MVTGDQLSLFMAFGAGIASFLAPCTLPLIPVYATYLLGTSDREPGRGAQGRLLVGAIAFVAGFTAVFLALGVSASFLGQLLLMNRAVLRQVAGALIFLFGAHLTGLLRVGWLERHLSLDLAGGPRPQGQTVLGHVARSFLLGVAFSAGWHPCIGPILGAILAYAGTTGMVGSGVKLLLIYSLGMAVPFVLLALFFERCRPLIDALKKHSILVSRVTGFVLMGMGVVVFFDLLVQLSRWTPVLLS